ncbi:hypothetical protein J6590_055492 [Homalodisca vitripennis]|nr:hypothetical protein J6590_055492 [Homalodisca vitripennis]
MYVTKWNSRAAIARWRYGGARYLEIGGCLRILLPSHFSRVLYIFRPVKADERCAVPGHERMWLVVVTMDF